MMDVELSVWQGNHTLTKSTAGLTSEMSSRTRFNPSGLVASLTTDILLHPALMIIEEEK